MAKNLEATRNANIIWPLPVASGVTAGQIVLIGAAGLWGWAQTDRVTTALLSDYTRTLPQGLVDGQASVELPGISTAVRLTVAGTPAVGDRIYRVAADGTYSTTATGNLMIGYALEILSGTVVVGLTRV